MNDPLNVYRQLLRSDGIGQGQRLPAGLEPDYFLLEDRSSRELVALLRQLADHVRLFDPASGLTIDSWMPFFQDFQNQTAEEWEHELARRQDFAPQFALVLAFLNNLKFVQHDLNEFTRRHLQFYYETILGLRPKTATADRVFLLFELNKTTATHRLPAGTVFDAGSSTDGKTLHYRTMGEVVLNHAKIAALRSLHVERNAAGDLSLWAAECDPAALDAPFAPFGHTPDPAAPGAAAAQPAVTGFALSSSLLALKEGTRHLTLTFYSEPFPDPAPLFMDMKGRITVQLTGEEAWLNPVVQKAEMRRNPIDDYRAMVELQILLPDSMPAVTAHFDAVHGGGLPAGVPALRIQSRQALPIPEVFSRFRVASASLKSSVSGHKTLIVQTEEGIQNAQKPFPVFGAQPAVGDQLLVGSREIFHKNITTLTLKVSWKNPPDLDTYYADYPDGLSIHHNSFSAELEILDDGVWKKPASGAPFLLFDADNEGYPLTQELNDSWFQGAQITTPLARATALPVFTEYRPGLRRGFVRLTLTGPDQPSFSAFGHAQYPNALASVTAQMVANPGGNIPLPKPPYTPQVREIAIDYTAEDQLFPGLNDTLFSLMPGGLQQWTSPGVPLFPEFDALGYLYVGLRDLKPLASANILFQLAEYKPFDAQTGTPDLRTPEVTWSYLGDANDWVVLRREQLVIDGTRDFQQSGILSIVLGADAGTEHLQLPGGLVWLRAALGQGLHRVSPIRGVHTQATEAELVIPRESTLADFSLHLETGLAAEKITKPQRRDPAIKNVRQPYPSQGGVAPEPTRAFSARGQERLRHRQRAVQPWDFERLTLDFFPKILRAKCLASGARPTAPEPGASTLVVITRVDSKRLSERLQPRANNFFLDQVRDYLATKASPFARITVRNPDYEEILADFDVKFQDGLDAQFYLQALNEALVRLLSPWAFDDHGDLHFDGLVYRSELLFFIENLPYVDYVTNFKVFHLHQSEQSGEDVVGKMKIGQTFFVHKPPNPNLGGMTIGESFIVGQDWEVIAPTGPASVLVSAERHSIRAIVAPRDCVGVSGLGIGLMTINLDFEVSKS